MGFYYFWISFALKSFFMKLRSNSSPWASMNKVASIWLYPALDSKNLYVKGNRILIYLLVFLSFPEILDKFVLNFFFWFVRSVQRMKIWDWIFVTRELFTQFIRSLCPFASTVFCIGTLKLITLLLLVKEISVYCSITIFSLCKYWLDKTIPNALKKNRN